jgi:hypothetical protein
VLPAHLWNLGKSIVNPTTNDIINATRQVRPYGGVDVASCELYNAS